MKKRKRENKEQRNFPGQSFILHHAQTEAFFIWFLKGISFTIKKFMSFGKCSVQNKIMLEIAMTVKKSLKTF